MLDGYLHSLYNEYKSGVKWHVIVEKCHKVVRKVLLNTYFHTLDPKGRIILPAKMREELGACFVITKGLGEKCICAYPTGEFGALAESLKSVKLSKNRQIYKALFATAMEVEPDKQGRFLPSQILKDYANITKEVAIVGQNDHVEIWDKQAWVDADAKLDEMDMLALMEEVGL